MFPRQVIGHGLVMYRTTAFGRILNQYGDSHALSGSPTKYFTTFLFPGLFIFNVPPQVKHPYVGKLIIQARPHPSFGISGKVRGRHDESYYAGFSYSVRRPAQRLDVRVVQLSFVALGRPFDVCVFYPLLHEYMPRVLVVLVGSLLSRRVWRIGHHPGYLCLALSSYTSFGRNHEIAGPLRYRIEVERVGKRYVFKFRKPARAPRVCGLAVYGGDIICQQYDLVGEQFVAIFPVDVPVVYQVQLHHTGEERARPRKRVDYAYVVGQPLAKVVAQHLVYGSEYEIHHLHGRIHYPQTVGHLGKRYLEELAVQLGYDRLAVIQAGDAVLYARIKSLQIPKLGVQAVSAQARYRILQRRGHRIPEFLPKQGVEYPVGYHVLRQHVYAVGL